MIATWAKQLEEIETTSRAAADFLGSMGTPTSRSAAQAINDKLTKANESRAPTIALVGQYNAGKSSLIKALTSADVAISGDIETAKARAFKWRGLNLVDTPGIKAGRPEHDEETESWLAKSDLLLFVITNELFDDVVGTYFRKLAYDQGRADLMMLVVNKIAREPNGADALPHMRPSLERVLSPRALEDYRCVAVDVQSNLDADAEPDETDRELLRERSRLSTLTSALEAFGQEKRIMARALVPLSVALQGLEQARDELVAGEDVERKDYLELLRRRAVLLRNTRAKVEFNSTSLISRHAAEVSKHAQELLRLLTPSDLTVPPKKEDLDEALARAKSKLDLHAEKLSKELQAGLTNEITRVNEELHGLGEGSLAKSLTERILRFDAPGLDTAINAPDGLSQADERFRKLIKDRLKGFGEVLQDAKKADVVNVARTFGLKFKPWGKAKALSRVQGLGNVIVGIGPILDVVFHVSDERRRDKAELELGDARKQVRESFSNAAEEFREASQTSITAVLADVFNPLLSEVEQQRDELRAEANAREHTTNALGDLVRRARKVWASAVRHGGVSEDDGR